MLMSPITGTQGGSKNNILNATREHTKMETIQFQNFYEMYSDTQKNYKRKL